MAKKSPSEKLPLDLQECEHVNPKTGLVEYLTALHPAWCADVEFLAYLPPSCEEEGGGVDPMWVDAMEMIDGDLHWLLQLPHQTFWCQVLYDATLHTLLDSYLRYAPRSYDKKLDLPLKVQQTLRNIHRRVFMVFLRMSTHKESTEHFFTPEMYGDIIYEHFLFDIPKLLDLCVLYIGANKPLLRKMVGNVFERQPKYQDDLRTCIQSILKLLDRAQSQVCTHEEGKKTARLDEVRSLSPLELSDLLLYLADVAATLCSFINVYPPAASELAKEHFPERIAAFYEVVVPTMQAQWHAQKHGMTNMAHMKTRFRQLKYDLAWLVDHLLHTCYTSPDSGDTPPISPTPHTLDLDSFLAAVTAILSEKSFLREFEKHFSLSSCVQEIQRSHPSVDETHFQYVLSALGVKQTLPPSGASSLMTGASSGATGSEKLPSLISHVKDILPHLGDRFIEECLKEFGNNPDVVISLVLDNTLPPRLQQMDQQAPRTRGEEPLQEVGTRVEKEWSQLQGKGEEGLSLLDQRSSVFDGDEFDVFRRKKDVDLSRVQVGKRFDASTIHSLLDDKSHLDSTRELYKAYTYGGTYEEEEEGGEEEGAGDNFHPMYEYDQYNDEYDDTYDSHHVTATDTVSTEELFSVKRLNEKGLYRRRFESSSEEEGEEEAREGVEFHPQSILQRNASKDVRSGHPGVGGPTVGAIHSEQMRRKPEDNPPHGRHQHKPHDRGGGRDDARSRQLKERHKGSHGNHNRRYLADRKRNKGMGAPPRY